MFDKAFVFHET